ncbi:MAG: carboxypeptidase-like regulatory domain-containing protein [Maribacter sp.]
MPTILFLMLFLSAFVRSQEVTKVNGTVMEMTTNQVISNTTIVVEGLPLEYTTDESGEFTITINRVGEFILQITSPDFEPKRIPIFLEGNKIDLGTVFLRPDITFEKSMNLVNLTEDELLDDEASSNTLALLQSTKDIFLNRVAFDFGQAFYRIRGYDSQYGEVFLNGLPMNKMYDGRPQWNNWGGLNDVIRNQQYANGLNASDFTFGGILGNTNIDLRPSGLRPGTRISSSMSNRT